MRTSFVPTPREALTVGQEELFKGHRLRDWFAQPLSYLRRSFLLTGALLITQTLWGIYWPEIIEVSRLDPVVLSVLLGMIGASLMPLALRFCLSHEEVDAGPALALGVLTALVLSLCTGLFSVEGSQFAHGLSVLTLTGAAWLSLLLEQELARVDLYGLDPDALVTSLDD